MVVQDHEAADRLGDQFPELDDAARGRAAERIREGADAHAALAAESVQTQITRVYN